MSSGAVPIRCVVAGALDLHRVVGDQAVAPLDQLDGGLALAHAGLAQQEHPLAVDLHQHAVAGDARGQVVPCREAIMALMNSRGGVLAAQDGAVVLLRHLHALREGLHAPGDDEGGDIVPQKLLKALPPLLRRQAGEIGGLHPADHLEPLGVEVVEKAGELQAGTVHILGADGPVLVALRPAQTSRLNS